MRRYRSGADLRRHLPGCAVCTSLCAVRSGQEAGGDRRSEDEPPNRSGYPSRRATTALSAGGTLSRPCCVPIIAFFPWFVNGFAEKFSDFFAFLSGGCTGCTMRGWVSVQVSQAAPAIKQVAHGRCLGRRHDRLILPCRFSVFICFCLCFCAFLRNLLSLRYFCSRRRGFQGVGAFMFYVVFVTRLPGCSISGVSRVNSCSVSAGFQVFLKQSFHFLRVRGIDDADTGIVDVDVLMPHAVDLPRFMYHDP